MPLIYLSTSMTRKLCSIRSPLPLSPSPPTSSSTTRNINFYKNRRLCNNNSKFDQEETITTHVPAANKIRSSLVKDIRIVSSKKCSNSIDLSFTFQGTCSMDYRLKSAFVGYMHYRLSIKFSIMFCF